jgi:hypothetical protein
MMIQTLRLYCELIPMERLLEPSFGDFFRALQVRLSAAGWSGQVELVQRVTLPREGDGVEAALLSLLERRSELSVDRLWLWGLLWDGEKSYLNAGSWEEVLCGWERLLEGLEGRGLVAEGLFFDLEPDLAVLRAAASGRWGELWALGRRRGRGSASVLSGLGERVEALRARSGGAPVLAACPPTGALGPLAQVVDRWLGVPVFDDAGGTIWPELTAMAYTSFLLPPLRRLGVPEGLCCAWAGAVGGWLARGHVERARRAGAVGSVICGLCGVGALGDEPVFAGPAQMRAQVEAVMSAGPSALEVFNVSGMMWEGGGYQEGRAPDPARWGAWVGFLEEALLTSGRQRGSGWARGGPGGPVRRRGV